MHPNTVAPYADTPIAVHLQAVSGMRYRLLSCVECSREFFERQGDNYYRVGVQEMPEEAHVDSTGGIPTMCGQCQQKYVVFFSVVSGTYRGDPLSFQKPQTIFLIAAPVKRPRDTYCLECHHAYLSVSDRISMISDNAMPIELFNESQLGTIEVRCKARNCKQRWAVRT
jgi:hypothetical protein